MIKYYAGIALRKDVVILCLLRASWVNWFLLSSRCVNICKWGMLVFLNTDCRVSVFL